MKSISCNQYYELYATDDIAKDFYIQRTGESYIAYKNNKHNRYLERGDVCGEYSSILWKKRKTTVTCTSWSEFYVISINDIQDVLQRYYPKSWYSKWSKIKKYAKKSLKKKINHRVTFRPNKNSDPDEDDLNNWQHVEIDDNPPKKQKKQKKGHKPEDSVHVFSVNSKYKQTRRMSSFINNTQNNNTQNIHINVNLSPSPPPPPLPPAIVHKSSKSPISPFVKNVTDNLNHLNQIILEGAAQPASVASPIPPDEDDDDDYDIDDDDSDDDIEIVLKQSNNDYDHDHTRGKYKYNNKHQAIPKIISTPKSAHIQPTRVKAIDSSQLLQLIASMTTRAQKNKKNVHSNHPSDDYDNDHLIKKTKSIKRIPLPKQQQVTKFSKFAIRTNSELRNLVVVAHANKHNIIAANSNTNLQYGTPQSGAQSASNLRNNVKTPRSTPRTTFLAKYHSEPDITAGMKFFGVDNGDNDLPYINAQLFSPTTMSLYDYDDDDGVNSEMSSSAISSDNSSLSNAFSLSGRKSVKSKLQKMHNNNEKRNKPNKSENNRKKDTKKGKKVKKKGKKKPKKGGKFAARGRGGGGTGKSANVRGVNDVNKSKDRYVKKKKKEKGVFYHINNDKENSEQSDNNEDSYKTSRGLPTPIPKQTSIDVSLLLANLAPSQQRNSNSNVNNGIQSHVDDNNDNNIKKDDNTVVEKTFIELEPYSENDIDLSDESPSVKSMTKRNTITTLRGDTDHTVPSQTDSNLGLNTMKKSTTPTPRMKTIYSNPGKKLNNDNNDNDDNKDNNEKNNDDNNNPKIIGTQQKILNNNDNDDNNDINDNNNTVNNNDDNYIEQDDNDDGGIMMINYNKDDDEDDDDDDDNEYSNLIINDDALLSLDDLASTKL